MIDVFSLAWLFGKIFLFLLVGAYFLPAGLAYGYFYIWKKEQWASQEIQKGRAVSRSVIRRDIRWSVLSAGIFAVLTTALYLAAKEGYTRMYFDPLKYGAVYLVGSFFLVLVYHDTYFYWVHRFMHWRPAYRYIHRVHHLTVRPTPWTIFAFQPLEAVLQYGIIPLVAFTLPVHPWVLIAAFSYNMIANVGGHLGFELVSEKKAHHWLLKYNNTVTHHDLHHSRFHCNYSQYFNIWDRVMKTFREAN